MGRASQRALFACPASDGGGRNHGAHAMSLLLVIAFILACALGSIAAWHAEVANRLSVIGMAVILSAAILSGSVTVAAEAGSAAARYLGLAALVLGSAALFSAFIAVWRIGRADAADPEARR